MISHSVVVVFSLALALGSRAHTCRAARQAGRSELFLNEVIINNNTIQIHDKETNNIKQKTSSQRWRARTARRA